MFLTRSTNSKFSLNVRFAIAKLILYSYDESYLLRTLGGSNRKVLSGEASRSSLVK